MVMEVVVDKIEEPTVQILQLLVWYLTLLAVAVAVLVVVLLMV